MRSEEIVDGFDRCSVYLLVLLFIFASSTRAVTHRPSFLNSLFQPFFLCLQIVLDDIFTFFHFLLRYLQNPGHFTLGLDPRSADGLLRALLATNEFSGFAPKNIIDVRFAEEHLHAFLVYQVLVAMDGFIVFDCFLS